MVERFFDVEKVTGSNPVPPTYNSILSTILYRQMGIVYILQSSANGRYYIGSTNNLERRLIEHTSGKSTYTRLTRPYKLVFSQQFESLMEARKVEYRLKKFKSRRIIEKIIQNNKILLKTDSSVD